MSHCCPEGVKACRELLLLREVGEDNSRVLFYFSTPTIRHAKDPGHSVAFCHDPGEQHGGVCTSREQSFLPYLEGNSRDSLPFLSFSQNLAFLFLRRFFLLKCFGIWQAKMVLVFLCVGGYFLSFLPSLKAETLKNCQRNQQLTVVSLPALKTEETYQSS